MSAVAIVQTAFIGDVVLATPLFEAARVSCPGDRVIAVVRPGCENLLQNNPNIDEIIVWNKEDVDRGIGGIFRMGSRLKKLGIHTALIPHRSFRTAMALWLSGVKDRIGFEKGGGGFVHSETIDYEENIHEVERNLQLAEAVEWKFEGFKPQIFPDDEDKAVIDKITNPETAYCVLAPGSVWETKKWSVESYIETGNDFALRGIKIYLSGSEADKDTCRKIADRIQGSVNTAGTLTLRQSAELFRRARFVLTGDTAPSHIAAAMDTLVFAIFGPTVRDFGFWPYSKKGKIIEKEDVECRPCSAHGPQKCPKKTHICMEGITSTEVIHYIASNL